MAVFRHREVRTRVSRGLHRQVGYTDSTGEVEQLDVDYLLRYDDLGSSRELVTEVQLNLTDFGGRGIIVPKSESYLRFDMLTRYPLELTFSDRAKSQPFRGVE